MGNIKKFWKKHKETLVIALVSFCLVRFVFDTTVVMSASMEPTLMTGDTVILYNCIFHKSNRGDIVAFPFGDVVYMKRIIGTGGDTIEIMDGCVFVNGQRLEEGYLPEGTETEPGNRKEYIVPEGCVFLLGDNRGDSNDSRYWENPYIEADEIIGYFFWDISAWYGSGTSIRINNYDGKI
ncbi:MAG: signal peptidase I [Clostridiales bacterium]|nr:signal peptidase I [Clostridiales bacterium]